MNGWHREKVEVHLETNMEQKCSHNGSLRRIYSVAGRKNLHGTVALKEENSTPAAVLVVDRCCQRAHAQPREQDATCDLLELVDFLKCYIGKGS